MDDLLSRISLVTSLRRRFSTADQYVSGALPYGQKGVGIDEIPLGHPNAPWNIYHTSKENVGKWNPYMEHLA